MCTLLDRTKLHVLYASCQNENTLCPPPPLLNDQFLLREQSCLLAEIQQELLKGTCTCKSFERVCSINGRNRKIKTTLEMHMDKRAGQERSQENIRTSWVGAEASGSPMHQGRPG